MQSPFATNTSPSPLFCSAPSCLQHAPQGYPLAQRRTAERTAQFQTRSEPQTRRTLLSIAPVVSLSFGDLLKNEIQLWKQVAVSPEKGFHAFHEYTYTPTYFL